MPTANKSAIQQTAQHLGSAQRIAVLTGAGISAESSIPTFRDAMTGFWAQFDPADLATPEAYARDPQRVSRWYDGCVVALMVVGVFLVRVVLTVFLLFQF